MGCRIACAVGGEARAVGLIALRVEQPTATLGPFLRRALTAEPILKPATKIVRGQVIRDLNEFFGESRDVRTITPGNADDFKQWLVGRKLAPTTIHKRLQVARSFFHAMRRRKLIDENPFDGVKAAATGIKDRQRFVTREEIAACWMPAPTTIGGPSLPWPATAACAARAKCCRSAGRTLIGKLIESSCTSPKTEHHAGKAAATIPLFPELRPILAEAFELAPDGAVFVVDEKFRKAAMGPGGLDECQPADHI